MPCRSLPTWERGSKRSEGSGEGGADRRSPRGSVDRNPDGQAGAEAGHVAPHAGAWIETKMPFATRSSARSLPTRERGSKHVDRGGIDRVEGRSPRGSVDRNCGWRWTMKPAGVAPHAGAWIETRAPGQPKWLVASLPTRGRGSKHRVRRRYRAAARRSPRGGVVRNTTCHRNRRPATVAPHAGAWIETRRLATGRRWTIVAPHAGAWIETLDRLPVLIDAASLPTRGRGSKRSQSRSDRRGHRHSPRGGVDRNVAKLIEGNHALVAPHAGAWIETPRRAPASWPRSSLPTRGRGSKRLGILKVLRSSRSLPTRGRGSKLGHDRGLCLRGSRSPRGGVDRNFMILIVRRKSGGRSPRGGVDRNLDKESFPQTPFVAPHAGAWIETSVLASVCAATRSLPTRGRGSKPAEGRRHRPAGGRSPRGGVDRNRAQTTQQ